MFKFSRSLFGKDSIFLCSKRSKVSILFIFIVAVAGLVYAAPAAFEPLFELEGNPDTDRVAPNEDADDWDQIWWVSEGMTNTSHAGVSVFVTDEPSNADSIFTIGSTKDHNDLDVWFNTIGTVPDKNDLLHAYAAAYSDGPTNYLFFGADRFVTNGDAQIGFWFFQSGATPEGGTWSDVHWDGDILVLSDFTNGGAISTIRVFAWRTDCFLGTSTIDPANCVDPNLEQIAVGNDCSSTADVDICATVNSVVIDPTPWPYQSKSGPANVFPPGAFYEGGLDITALGLTLGCNTTFLAETRSSQSVDAILKDYVTGTFNACSILVDKSGPSLSKNGDDVTYTFTIQNTNITPLELTSCNDSIFGDLTPECAAVSECLILAAAGQPGDTCSFDYTVPVGDPGFPTSSQVTNEFTAVYHAVDAVEDTVENTDSHTLDLFYPAISLSKTGDAESKVGDTVNYTITLNNNSSALTPDLDCTITDTKLGISESVTLVSGASEVINASYVVQPGDADPLLNTADVICSPIGFPNEFPDSASHSVDLFLPSITFDKTGDTLSKVGDDVDYTLTLTNTSSVDTPDLECTITDAILGISKSVTLASGASDVTNANYVVQPDDPDPLLNTADVICSPIGYPNEVTGSDDHSVELFQPSISFDKTGDAVSKVGDDVDYTITLTNTSSVDTPDLECTITDTMLGINKSVTLASGASDVTDANYVVQPGDADPLLNTADVICSPIGFPNQLPGSDGHSVDLFQPSISFDKTGDAVSKVGDDVDYTITLNNTSSVDTPDLECTITDTMLGINKFVTLASGASDVTNANYVVQQGDADPLLNTADVICSPIGYPNQLPGSDGHSVDLIHPSFSVAKTCDAEPINFDEDASFTVTIANTGDVDLNINADDGIGAFTLPAGQTQNFNTLVPGPHTPGGTADNTVTASWTLPAEYGLVNTDEASASDSCDVLMNVKYETAYGYGDYATCFIDLGAGNWGWVNGLDETSILPGTYTWPVYAGAGQCDLSKGTLVGNVEVRYDGTDVFVTWLIDAPHILGDTHVYAGTSQIPSSGFSPGNWEIEGPFSGEQIYIIVHAIVGVVQ
jgi:uncharacterized repeat protein (TIGR01451 family)